MRKLGKKGSAWQKARARLKKEYRDRGIDSCEIPGCESRYFALSFHHRHKRKENDPHTFENTLLVCAKHHDLGEKGIKGKELTREWFKELRKTEPTHNLEPKEGTTKVK